MLQTLNRWATPLTIGSFIITAITGVLIFFHINIGLVKPAHEWLSWLMVIGVGAHIAFNWRSFARYFSTSKKLSLAIIGVCVALTVASVLPLGAGNDKGRPAAFKAADAMNQAALAQVAAVIKQDPAALMAKLQAQNLQVTDPSQTLTQIAQSNGTEAIKVLNVVLSKP
jgi:hypothetical protein